MNFDNLKPPHDVYKIKHPSEYVIQGSGVTAERRIFLDVQFTQYELDLISKLKAALKEEKVDVPIDWAPAHYLRFLYSGDFKVKGKDGAIDRIQKCIELLNSPVTGPLTSNSEKLLRNGTLYLAGIDKKFRPIIVMNLPLIDMKTINVDDFVNAQANLFNRIRENMFVPGIVERWQILIETGEKGIHEISLSLMGAILNSSGYTYPETIEKTFLLNVSRSFEFSWFLAKNLITEKNRKKIFFVKQGQYNLLREEIESHQLEMKYGGTKQNLRIGEYWPPKSPFMSLKSETNHPSLDLGVDFAESKIFYERPPEGAEKRPPGNYLNKAKLSSSKVGNDFGRLSEQRQKPMIFKDRVSTTNFSDLDGLDRRSSPVKKIQFPTEVQPDPKDVICEYKVDDSSYDLNDLELLLIVQTENKKLKKELVPEEEVEGFIKVKDKMKTHSELPLYVSKVGKARNIGTRSGAYGGGGLTERPSMRERMSMNGISHERVSITPVGYQITGSGDGISVWQLKKSPTEQEEDEDDDRGGIFCGICTTRQKVKGADNSPEKRQRPSKWI